MKKKIIIGLVLLLVIGYLGFNYVMAPPKDIRASKADISLKTDAFLAEFNSNMSDAEKKYTDKIIAIEGKISEVEDNGITIDNKVFCQLENTSQLKKGTVIKVKGLFIGYDELFELVKLDQGKVIQ